MKMVNSLLLGTACGMVAIARAGPACGVVKAAGSGAREGTGIIKRSRSGNYPDTEERDIDGGTVL